MLRAPEMDAALRRLVEAAIAEDLGGLPGEPGAIDQTVAAAISPEIKTVQDRVAGEQHAQ